MTYSASDIKRAMGPSYREAGEPDGDTVRFHPEKYPTSYEQRDILRDVAREAIGYLRSVREEFANVTNTETIHFHSNESPSSTVERVMKQVLSIIQNRPMPFDAFLALFDEAQGESDDTFG